jgi:hypothetical protein
VARATGSVPVLPEPNSAAERAAKHYRTLAPGQVPRGTSGAGQRSSGPAGFLAPDDLGTGATWSAGAAETGTPLQAQLPGCASGSPVLVYGKGAGLAYRGVPPDNGRSGAGPDTAGWSVYEMRVTLDPATVPTVQAALAAAAACPRGQVTTPFGAMTMEESGATRALVRQDRSDGSTGAARGWILHDTTLVQLDALAGNPTGSSRDGTLPGGAAWFRQLMDRAEALIDG